MPGQLILVPVDMAAPNEAKLELVEQLCACPGCGRAAVARAAAPFARSGGRAAGRSARADVLAHARGAAAQRGPARRDGAAQWPARHHHCRGGTHALGQSDRARRQCSAEAEERDAGQRCRSGRARGAVPGVVDSPVGPAAPKARAALLSRGRRAGRRAGAALARTAHHRGLADRRQRRSVRRARPRLPTAEDTTPRPRRAAASSASSARWKMAPRCRP